MILFFNVLSIRNDKFSWQMEADCEMKPIIDICPNGII
jgi:hypothetical protein